VRLWGLLLSFFLFAAPAGASDGDIVQNIKARGYVTCGFRPSVGFAYSDDNGKLSGFLVDFCHALAAAVLGDADAIRAERLPDKPGEFVAVENHAVDIAFHNTTWTLSRDVSYAIQFTVPIFYDGQGFALWTDHPPVPLRDLVEQRVCVKSPTTTQHNLEDFISQTQRNWTIRLFKTYEEALQAFLGNECGMLTTDSSVLAMSLANYRGVGSNIHIYPDVISREPLTPYVPAGDDNWLEIVRSVIFATILAEEKGVTASNVSVMRDDPDVEVRRLLGTVSGNTNGLRPDWALQVIAQVGNYGEIFERNLGSGSPYKMQRGLNQLWTHGGLMYSPQLQ
jgi:general L-amino acid transport system substrate-binding protein